LYGQKNYDSTTMKKTLWLHYGEILLNQKLNYLDNLIQHIKMVWNTHFQKFIYFHIQRKNLFSMQTKNTLINRLSTSKIIRNTLSQKFIYICLHTWIQFPFNFLTTEILCFILEITLRLHYDETTSTEPQALIIW